MTTAADPTPFLHAIRDNPDCDTTRLVYADWLDEHGQDKYAAFIRRQINQANEKANLVGRIRAFHHNQTPIHFEDILGVRPWEDLRFDHWGGRYALMFLMGYGPWSKVDHGIGWHRGFPAVVCCTERNWHIHFERFIVPPQLVCLRFSRGLWGCYHCSNRNAWVRRSLVNRSIPEIVEYNDVRKTEYEKAVFPNVRHFRWGCTVDTLRQFVMGRLPD